HSGPRFPARRGAHTMCARFQRAMELGHVPALLEAPRAARSAGNRPRFVAGSSVGPPFWWLLFFGGAKKRNLRGSAKLVTNRGVLLIRCFFFVVPPIRWHAGNWGGALPEILLTRRQCPNLHGMNIGLHEAAQGVIHQFVALQRLDAV